MCKVYDFKTGSLLVDTKAPVSTSTEKRWPELTQYAKDLGISIIAATEADKSRSGLHINDPTVYVLEEMISWAQKRHHKNIFVYTTRTATQA